MAIEIIEHGNQNPNEKHEAECWTCKCKFLFQREDCYWSRPLLSYIVTCPECGKEVEVGDIFER